MRAHARHAELAAVALITLAAAVLRLVHVGRVAPDPFYDAAVRSMGLSWHNFFFGAFEPAGSVSIDKPPIDLWLQVASVKLLGFSPTTLKIPEALAGTASVPLLYACVRRLWGVAAALAAALAMAVLPVEVITARSDTMDAVMMLLILAALYMLIRAAEGGRTAWLLGSAAALGLAFDVKLLESVVALPALALVAYLGLPSARPRRLAQLAGACAVYLAVALCWLTGTLLVPGHERPYAIGSTNGSAWNAAFVFNGTERLGGKSPEPQTRAYEPGHHYPVATQTERDHIPIVPPSATRLLARIGPLSGQRLGLVLLAALLLGTPALASAFWRRRTAARSPDDIVAGRWPDMAGAQAAPGNPRPALAGNPHAGLGGNPHPAPAGNRRGAEAQASNATDAADLDRVRGAVGIGLVVWLITGVVLFSQMERLHPRYVEVLSPAVAAMLGIGVAWTALARGRAPLAVLAATLLIVVVYAERLLYGFPLVWWVTLTAALGALACTALARRPGASARVRGRRAPAGVLACTLVAVLAVPLAADLKAISDDVSDAGNVGALPDEELRLVSAYLRAHQGDARYEVAAASATGVGALIVRDARPVLALTSYNARVFTTVAELKRLIAQRQVRYAFLNSGCGRRAVSVNPACSAPVRWVRAHASDVSRDAGLREAGVLWRLPAAPSAAAKLSGEAARRSATALRARPAGAL
jgi:4-amino-4-deoxy-L-arabinose transferase-like glycosyltransferase